MSLDFYLIMENQKIKKDGSGIFIRENGMTKEISAEEWSTRFPDREPVTAVNEDDETDEVFHANITHNLGQMATKAGIYDYLWRPDENGITKAYEIIDTLETGIKLMVDAPDVFKRLNPKNGWGSYDQFLPWLRNVLNACKKYQEATIQVSR